MWLVAAYQKAIREQRLAAEISAAKRERDFYLSRVDKAKAVAAQQERKRKVGCTTNRDTRYTAWICTLHMCNWCRGLCE